MFVIQFLNNLTSFTLLKKIPGFEKKMWAFKNTHILKPNPTKPN